MIVLCELHAASEYALSGLSPCLLRRSRTTNELLQSDLGSILFGVVNVLAVIPKAGIDDLVAFDGDRGGPRGAPTSAIRNDVEDWRNLLCTATVVYSVVS